MNSNLQIHHMSADEIQTAINWARFEGWNPGLNDSDLFYKADPNGFFAGKIDGKIVAVGSAVCYDDEFAFCGLYIVDPDYRGLGYGMALTKARLEYCGNRNIGIDGVLENVKLYEKIGYHKYYENARYQFTARQPAVVHPYIYNINEISFNTLKKYDRQCFPGARDNFLKAWIAQENAVALGYFNNNLKGYIVCRKCHEGYKIGPLFADNIKIADTLLMAAISSIPGKTIFIDIPEINLHTTPLITKYDMKKVFATARMYQKGLPDFYYEKVFGITTFELG